mgnify:CR=1 FL=1
MLSTSRLQSIIWTSRLDEAQRFYRDMLGLALKGESDGALVFDVSGSDLRVSPIPSTTPTEHTVLGFSVPDVASVVTVLTDRGIVFERFSGFPHGPDGILTTPGGSKVAWFRDPDGNLLSVVQFPQHQ